MRGRGVGGRRRDREVESKFPVIMGKFGSVVSGAKKGGCW